MKHKLLLTLPVALLLGCQAPEPKANEPENTPTTMNTTNEQNAIEELLFAYRDALIASSTDHVIPLYTADGVFMPTVSQHRSAPSKCGRPMTVCSPTSS